MSTFVELCAGSAAVTCRLFGIRTLSPYMGSKTQYADQILEHLQLSPEAGGGADNVVLNDPGEWGWTLGTVLMDRQKVQAHIAAELAPPDRELFDRWRSQPVPADYAERAARHLYLQVRTYRAKPVYPLNDRTLGWKTHGFDPEWRDIKTRTSPKTHNRGWATPRPKLIERIGQFKLPVPVTVIQNYAENVTVISGATVYIDPDYQNATGYEHTFPREKVLAVAQRWANAGCLVGVSEAEPLPGGRAVALASRRSTRSFGTCSEYLTLFDGR